MNPFTFVLLVLTAAAAALGIGMLVSRRRRDPGAEARRSRSHRARPSLDEVAASVRLCDDHVLEGLTIIRALQREIKDIRATLNTNPRPGVQQETLSAPRDPSHRRPNIDFEFSNDTRPDELQDLSPAPLWAQLQELLDRYCARRMPMRDLRQRADQLGLVWGEVDVNEMPPVFRSRREGDVMAFGTPGPDEILVVVSEDCMFSKVRLGRFFPAFKADRPDQRVFATKPASAILTAEGTVEAKRSGVLEARGSV
jgi:hypothetical protein